MGRINRWPPFAATSAPLALRTRLLLLLLAPLAARFGLALLTGSQTAHIASSTAASAALGRLTFIIIIAANTAANGPGAIDAPNSVPTTVSWLIISAPFVASQEADAVDAIDKEELPPSTVYVCVCVCVLVGILLLVSGGVVLVWVRIRP